MHAYHVKVKPGDCFDIAGKLALVVAVYQSGWAHPIFWSPSVDTVLVLRDQRVKEEAIKDFVLTRNMQRVET